MIFSEFFVLLLHKNLNLNHFWLIWHWYWCGIDVHYIIKDSFIKYSNDVLDHHHIRITPLRMAAGVGWSWRPLFSSTWSPTGSPSVSEFSLLSFRFVLHFIVKIRHWVFKKASISRNVLFRDNNHNNLESYGMTFENCNKMPSYEFYYDY